MIDESYSNAYEANSLATHNARDLLIAAWCLAHELDDRSDRVKNALIGLINLAEESLDKAIEAHIAEWEIAHKKQNEAA